MGGYFDLSLRYGVQWRRHNVLSEGLGYRIVRLQPKGLVSGGLDCIVVQ